MLGLFFLDLKLKISSHGFIRPDPIIRYFFDVEAVPMWWDKIQI